jgi:uncharacterized damage-inducible protein DinB
MNTLIKSIEAVYRGYKTLAERALDQVTDAQLSEAGPANGNSLAVICWHVAGNLRSRFTDFLTTDGEKPWRKRDEEFDQRTVTRAELLAKWTSGWDVLFASFETLTDDDLMKTVTIRGESLAVHEALNRSVTHTSYHVGQIVYLAHVFAAERWKYLSIPPGGSAAYEKELAGRKPV